MVLLRCGAPDATFVLGRSLQRRDRRWRRGLELTNLLPYLRISLLVFNCALVSREWMDLVLWIRVSLLLLRPLKLREVRTKLLSRPCMTVAVPLSSRVMDIGLLPIRK